MCSETKQKVYAMPKSGYSHPSDRFISVFQYLIVAAESMRHAQESQMPDHSGKYAQVSRLPPARANQ